MGSEGVQIIGEDVVGTEQAFNAHGGGDVGDLEQSPEIEDREHQHAGMPSVPLIKARPSFSASVTGEMPAASNASWVA